MEDKIMFVASNICMVLVQGVFVYSQYELYVNGVVPPPHQGEILLALFAVHLLSTWVSFQGIKAQWAKEDANRRVSD
ncbi:MAG: hypothetical protein WCK01_03200 [Candidatus Uhrbacteria bacterium]